MADMDEDEEERLYRMIGLGALKYFIIKVDPKKTMLFNPKESIDFNGNTGPFIQYTHARIRSILRKASERGWFDSAHQPWFGAAHQPWFGSAHQPVPERSRRAAHQPIELSAKEVRLIKLLNLFPSKVAEGADAYSPAIIANYAFDLAKEFNQYYHETPILKEEDPQMLQARLVLIDTLSAVLRRAMGILGIELPERM
jgi:arginyl-tRNA synthetase